MESFRNPKYLERYEDTYFDIETPINTTVANNSHQKKDGYRFVVDNSGEVTPLDWFNSRLEISFKVNKLANGADIAVDDHNGIVNSIHSFIKNFNIKLNGKKVYDGNEIYHATNIKSLLEYSTVYADSTGTNEFFHLDTKRAAEERPDEATYNRGFAQRKLVLGTSNIVTRELPLNRYSYFEALRNILLPSGKMELNFEFASDNTLIWQAADNCRVILTKLVLIVPRITFNSEGQSLYMSRFLKPFKWTYLRENIERSNSLRQQSGNFKISSGIQRPRHVFVFIINDANIESQTSNPFLYNTFSVSTNPRTLQNCYLDVGNGEQYPENQYNPSTELTRVYRDALKYVHKNNEYNEGSLLNISNFQTLFPFVYFDLTKQKTDIRDGTTKLTFRYELSGGTATDYSIHALILNEQDAELIQQNGKLIFR